MSDSNYLRRFLDGSTNVPSNASTGSLSVLPSSTLPLHPPSTSSTPSTPSSSSSSQGVVSNDAVCDFEQQLQPNSTSSSSDLERTLPEQKIGGSRDDSVASEPLAERHVDEITVLELFPGTIFNAKYITSGQGMLKLLILVLLLLCYQVSEVTNCARSAIVTNLLAFTAGVMLIFNSALYIVHVMGSDVTFIQGWLWLELMLNVLLLPALVALSILELRVNGLPCLNMRLYTDVNFVSAAAGLLAACLLLLDLVSLCIKYSMLSCRTRSPSRASPAYEPERKQPENDEQDSIELAMKRLAKGRLRKLTRHKLVLKIGSEVERP